MRISDTAFSARANVHSLADDLQLQNCNGSLGFVAVIT